MDKPLIIKCSKCKIQKESTEFNKDRTKKNGLFSSCKVCNREQLRKSYYKHKEKRAAYKKQYIKNNPDIILNQVLKRKYNITIETYKEMLAAQNNVCKICKKSPTRHERLSVDHCHDTKNVRGLLCHYCNTALGNFKDDVTLLKNAIKYLEETP